MGGQSIHHHGLAGVAGSLAVRVSCGPGARFALLAVIVGGAQGWGVPAPGVPGVGKRRTEGGKRHPFWSLGVGFLVWSADVGGSLAAEEAPAACLADQGVVVVAELGELGAAVVPLDDVEPGQLGGGAVGVGGVEVDQRVDDHV